jgi:hypothetical protein
MGIERPDLVPSVRSARERENCAAEVNSAAEVQVKEYRPEQLHGGYATILVNRACGRSAFPWRRGARARPESSR